jgi:ubiquinone/menaquinone biosynthesis C-methylase UbiE
MEEAMANEITTPSTLKPPKKAYKGMAMEGAIATWYARNTKGDIRGFRQCADAVAANLPPRARVLEVAPGPGYLAIELAKRGGSVVTGLDISETFVRIAQDNARAEGVEVDFRHGNASAMPFPDGSFDFIVCRAAFKNFSDPVGALDEMHRVLAPGGRASIFDLRKDASLEEIAAEVAGMHLTAVNAWLTKLVFRTTLLKNAYAKDALERMVAASRFGQGEVRRDGIGFELRLAKADAQD